MEVKQTPGWYADPSGEAEYRWWDGTEWTARTNTREAVLHEALDAKPARLADWALQQSMLAKVTMIALVVAFVALSVFGLTRVFLRSEEQSEGEAPPTVIEVSGGPVSLDTCPTTAAAAGSGGCPVRIELKRVECGIGSLADPTTAAPPNFVPTGTLSPDAGQFCILGYEVTNTATSALASIPVAVRLVDADANTYSQAAEGTPLAAAVRTRFEVDADAGVGPGATVSAAAVFDLPAGVTPTEAVFVGGLGVDQASVELG